MLEIICKVKVRITDRKIFAKSESSLDQKPGCDRSRAANEPVDLPVSRLCWLVVITASHVEHLHHAFVASFGGCADASTA